MIIIANDNIGIESLQPLWLIYVHHDAHLLFYNRANSYIFICGKHKCFNIFYLTYFSPVLLPDCHINIKGWFVYFFINMKWNLSCHSMMTQFQFIRIALLSLNWFLRYTSVFSHRHCTGHLFVIWGAYLLPPQPKLEVICKRDKIAVIGQWSTNQSDTSMHTPISVKIISNLFADENGKAYVIIL